ncbi:MAG: HAMP domain-containing histidine kinase, partial [candidate division Zixibacteria bacterium]|nr:HAMP domain-containing histidine kinase [candidate division Zixibacteria bacterium]
AHRHKELLEMHEQLAAKSALAWMGMAGSTWAHSVTTKAVVIKENAQALRSLVAVACSLEGMEEKLKRIEDQAEEIQGIPITVPLSTEEGVTLVGVNALLRERIPRVCRQRAEDVQIEWCLSSPDVATVKISPEWLRRALDILVDNAIEAMIKCPVKVLTVSSEVKGGTVEISIADTGRGIPEQDRAKLFREPVPSEKGTGMGLLLALTIVEAYGGDIRLETTGPLGTTMVISLPLE